MLSRKFFTNDMWKTARAYSESEAWLDLIQSARFEASEITSRIGVYDVTFGRGQYPAANRFLAKKWGWGEQRVKSFLERLKKNKMITTECTQGVNVITLCKYDDYNSVKKDKNPHNNSVDNPANSINNSELQELVTHLVTQQITQMQPTYNPNKNKAKTEKKIKEKTSTIVDAKDTPGGVDCDEAPKKPLKTWKEDFNVYRQELDAAYAVLIADNAFMAERQRFHPSLDINLSLEKAYKDYWATEAGWQHKKKSKTNVTNWKSTFSNALTLGSNQVKRLSGRTEYVPTTESQKKFTEYLKANAPLLLNMPVQPTDEEIAELRKIKPSVMLSIVSDINNNRYLTNGRNSVYQTIMEIKQKQ